MKPNRVGKQFAFLCVAIGTGVASLSNPAFAAGASSTFNADADGWVVVDSSGNGGTTPATWNDGGYISTGDIYGWNSFGAPTKFLGNLLGQKLSFDLSSSQNDSAANTFFTVLIASGSTELYWYGGTPSTNGFSSFSVNLDMPSTGWRIGGNGYSNSGAIVTQHEFASVLSNVTRLHIDADWYVGPDNVRLDNVTISPVPEPETYAMMLAGLGLLGFMARRKRTA
jgi:hypothetical protein